MDNRGNRIIVSDTDSAINTPAIGAAHVVNSYVAKAPDELSLEVTASLKYRVSSLPKPHGTIGQR